MTADTGNKTVPFCDRYSVSSCGTVVNNETGKILKERNTSDGYAAVWLQLNPKKVKVARVSRLVLETFIGPPPQKGMHAAHLNGVKSDNRLENLIWATPSQNEKHKRQHGTAPIGSHHPAAKLTEAVVAEIRKELKGGVLYRVLADRYHVSRSTIGLISREKIWKEVGCV